MYAFRKPFTAATFDVVPGWHFALDYKIALVIAQAVGYALSKLIGVKVISEIEPARRSAAIVGLIGAAWLALIAFALVPAPWNIAALFLNGLPLGMIWGLVFATWKAGAFRGSWRHPVREFHPVFGVVEWLRCGFDRRPRLAVLDAGRHGRGLLSASVHFGLGAGRPAGP